MGKLFSLDQTILASARSSELEGKMYAESGLRYDVRTHPQPFDVVIWLVKKSVYGF